METECRVAVPSWIAPLASCFLAAGSPLYFVGGYVRNALLSLPPSDRDISGSANGEEVIALVKRAGAKAHLRDAAMGTVDILIGEHALEYTSFRTESYGKGGEHRPQSVLFTKDKKEDALRRDFTVNALYADALTGRVSDPLGGLSHLEEKRLVSCREPHITLSDDGLRILRMVRFGAELHFSIHPALYRTAKEMVSNLEDVAIERQREEWIKILLADVKYPSLQEDAVYPAPLRGLWLLQDLSLLFRLLPFLQEGDGLEQPLHFHRFDVLGHGMATCAATPPVLSLRIAGLLHDVAKPRCFRLTGGKMHGHELQGPPMAEALLRRLRVDNATISSVSALIARHMFDLDGRARENTCRKRFSAWGFSFVRQLIQLRRADIQGSGRQQPDYHTVEKWKAILSAMEEEGAIDDMSCLAVSGKDLMHHLHLLPGKRIGRIKQLLFERVAIHPDMNNRERLLKESEGIHKGLPETVG